jgi:signal transduction histidine kinase/DNA-binding response OmpR family regulator/ligand-binding sensor domain-containing protein
MKRNRFSLLIGIFLLCCSFSFDHDFKILTMQDGLTDNNVMTVYQDGDGFMWFGTANGLCRYDGQKFTSVRMSTPSMPVNHITDLSRHCLGFISRQCLYCFSRQTSTLIPVIDEKGKSNMTIANLIPAGGDRFWIFNHQDIMLCRLTEVNDHHDNITAIRITRLAIHHVLTSGSVSLTHFCYSEDHRGIFLVSTEGQVYYFDIQKSRITRTFHPFSTPGYVCINSMMTANGFLWLGTIGKGITRYHIATGRTDCLNKTAGPQALSHTDVYSMTRIDDQHLLAATWSGYTIITLQKDNPFLYTTEAVENPTTLTRQYFETRLQAACYDPHLKIIWLGTFGGGIAYADMRQHYYGQMRQASHNEICGIVADPQQHIWIATFAHGLMRSKAPFEKEEQLEMEEVGTPEVRTHKTVLCAYADRQGIFWFGNKDGTLTSYNPSSKSFRVHRIRDEKGRYNGKAIWSLLSDRNGHLWIGTDDGVLWLNAGKDVFRRISFPTSLTGAESVPICTMAQTADGAIWLGTEGMGLFRLQFRAHDILFIKGYEKSWKDLQYHVVRSLLAAHDGKLYIGYTDGFAVLSPQENKITQVYTTQNGMCSNFVGCITEDKMGHIWMGSSSGISHYSRRQHIFYNYYISGNNRSAFRLDNTLFFGNNRNLTYLNPSDIESHNHKDRPVLITGLKIDNRAVNVGERRNGQVVLPFDFPYIKTIVLSNRNRDFSISFNNLLFSSDFRRYEYRLYPYQKEWLLSNEDDEVSYTNLPDGKYTFEVRSVYPNGKTGSITRMPIRILPHWTHTVWFRLLLTLIFIALLVYLYNYLKRRQQRLEQNLKTKNELTMVRLKWEKECQIRKERENFFSYAAHELRTPLTLILAPLTELIHIVKPDDVIYGKLMTIYKNGTSLHTLVDQLLYEQKVEAGMLKLRLSLVDIIEVTKNIADSFCQLAESRNISFTFRSPKAQMMLWVDLDKVSSAITNLLSNAFKYTPAGGTIAVTIAEQQIDGKSFASIAIADTGGGIPPEKQEHIFDSFVTGEQSPYMSSKVGLGLRIVKYTAELHHGQIQLQSEVGKGSTFTLIIPEGKEHFALEEYEIADSMPVVAPEETARPATPAEEDNHEVPKKSILIVDDNPDIRTYISTLFAHSYRILEAADGKEGVEQALAHLPNLIISDIMMPVMDGFECCRTVRSDEKTAHIPIIMLTAKAEDADVLRGSQCGADDYMMKPFNPEILIAKANNLIRQRERLERIYTKALILRPMKDNTEEPSLDEFLETVIHTIEANMSDTNFSVKILAEKLNMSQPTLFRKMKQHTDLSVVDMIRNIRISKAASLLMQKKYTIQEISDMVGFNDIRIFRKHFTQQFGVSPSNFAGK